MKCFAWQFNLPLEQMW